MNAGLFRGDSNIVAVLAVRQSDGANARKDSPKRDLLGAHGVNGIGAAWPIYVFDQLWQRDLMRNVAERSPVEPIAGGIKSETIGRPGGALACS